MAIPLEQDTGTEPVTIVEGDFLRVESSHPPLRIHLQVDAVDGMGRDVLEGLKALPRRGVEVGGLLLGRSKPFMDAATGETGMEIWLERFQRIECSHKFGPPYILDEEDQAGLEEAAARIAEAGELLVLGTYRSHTRPGFQLEEADIEFADRYFRDPADLLLLIRPETSELQARFYARAAGEMAQAGGAFAFRGRALGLMPEPEPDTSRMPEIPAGGGVPGVDPEEEGEEEPTGRRRGVPAEPTAPVQRAPRLVPDFVPAGDAPNPRPVFNSPIFGTQELGYSRMPEPAAGLRKWWPLAAAVVLVTGAVAILFLPATKTQAGPAEMAVVNGPFRPLGLYVDPAGGGGATSSGESWRVTWNQAATSLAEARSARLFVRDGDDQSRIDLSPDEWKGGVYPFKPKNGDVTFRLEVTGLDGRVSAESFRVMRAGSSTPAAPGLLKPGVASGPVEQALKAAHTRAVPPKATRRVPPVVPASIRPRVRGSIPIDVRVKVDSRGRVTGAAPIGKHSGLEAYLADRAVAAAKQWRFAPAREDGKAVAGTQTLHFVFEK